MTRAQQLQELKDIAAQHQVLLVRMTRLSVQLENAIEPKKKKSIDTSKYLIKMHKTIRNRTVISSAA